MGVVLIELSGKTALVTGAAKRIGRAIASGLAREGVNVVVHYNRSRFEAEKLQKELTDLGVKSWLVQADLGSSDSCTEIIKKSAGLAGSLDILVNNASVFFPLDIKAVKLEDIEAEMLTNAWAPFLLTRCFSEELRSGSIVNILDTRIVGYDFNHFAYYLSKRMLEVLTMSMALKLAPNITVNGVAPGLILPPEGKDFSYLEQKKDTVPMKKYGSPSDVVDAVLFLIRSQYITGQVIYVDGGKHLIQTQEGI